MHLRWIAKLPKKIIQSKFDLFNLPMISILKSIPAKIVLSIFTIEALIFLFMGPSYFAARNTILQQEVSRRLAQPGILLSEGILHDRQIRDKILCEQIINEDLQELFFVNNHGRVSYSINPLQEGQIYLNLLDKKELELLTGNISTEQQKAYLTNSGTYVLTMIYPIWKNQKFTGSLFLKINAKHLHEGRASIFFSYLFRALIISILTSLLGGVAIHFLIVKRLQHTSMVLQKVSEGDISKRISVTKNNDQLDHLMFQINTMIETTEVNTQHLRETIKKLHQVMEKSKDAQLQLMHAEKLSALGRLSASIVHEFGNPLLGVRFMLEDINKRVELTPEDQQLVFLGLEECDRMKSLLKDLRNLNKPSSEIKTSFNIEQTIDNILTFHEKYFRSNKIVLEKKYNLFFPEIIAIEDQITQVLINIIINAAAAIPETGGYIKISTDTVDNNTISIQIKDTGVGISFANQKKIFEPFFSTKTDGDGTGLGLTVSYGIVQNHGGKLSFTSRPDLGTTFRISLPTGYEYSIPSEA